MKRVIYFLSFVGLLFLALIGVRRTREKAPVSAADEFQARIETESAEIAAEQKAVADTVNKPTSQQSTTVDEAVDKWNKK